MLTEIQDFRMWNPKKILTCAKSLLNEKKLILNFKKSN